MDAQDNPVKRRGRREYNTDDMPIAQQDSIDLSLGVELPYSPSLELVEDMTAEEKNEYKKRGKEMLYKDMLFNEEAVTIRIEENQRGGFVEPYVAAYVNGKPAEVLHDGKWVAAGWLPVGKEITIKRKYLEVLARAKPDAVTTEHDDTNVADPQNRLHRRTSSAYPVTVIEDRNPKGHQWLTRIKAGY